MQKGKIEAKKISFIDLFSEKFWFIIPAYQRPYVWQDDNINDLLDDLYYAFETQPDNDYFLGSLVLQKTNNPHYSEYDVLDGQQRLTTLLLMMAVIRDLSIDADMRIAIQNTLYQKKNVYRKIPCKARLTYKIRDNVDEFFEKVIIAYAGTEQEEYLLQCVNTENTTLSNLARGVLFIRKILIEKNNLQTFLIFIFHCVLFIYVAVDNTQDAFRMFTILNDRGIPLTSAHILKSQNIGALSSEHQVQKYAEIWENIENERGDDFDRFLKFIRTILVKERAKGNLIDEFEEKIYNKTKPLLNKGRETIEFIAQYDSIYEKIVNLRDKSLSNEYRNLLAIMKEGFRSEDWIPPLLYYFERFGHYRLLEFLKKLDYKFSGDWICGVTPSQRFDAMNTILQYIGLFSADNILSSDAFFKVSKDELRRQLDSPIYKKYYVKYLLLKVEYCYSDHSVQMGNYNTISIEHILPQKPNPGSEWLTLFPDKEKEFWINRIANLVLISRKKNSSLSNLDFEEKKKKYLNSGVDVFRASKVFLETHTIWTPTLLSKRQADLINLLSADV